MKTKHTQRTLAELRKRGMPCAIVEKWNGYAGAHGIRQDMFGIIDIVALDKEKGVVGVQSTGDDFSGHWAKLTGTHAKASRAWLETFSWCSCCGGSAKSTTLELWAWRKIKGKFVARVKEITLRDLNLKG